MTSAAAVSRSLRTYYAPALVLEDFCGWSAGDCSIVLLT